MYLADCASLSLNFQICKMGIYPLPYLQGFLGFGNGGRGEEGNETEKEDDSRAFW